MKILINNFIRPLKETTNKPCSIISKEYFSNLTINQSSLLCYRQDFFRHFLRYSGILNSFICTNCIFLSIYFRDRRELGIEGKMERHKDTERERRERELRFRQQQERENQDCDAEQKVTEHFEESLRRAKEKVSRFLFFNTYIPC